MEQQITNFNEAVDRRCQQVSELVDVMNDSNASIFDNEEFLDFVKYAENIFESEPATPIEDLDSV